MKLSGPEGAAVPAVYFENETLSRELYGVLHKLNAKVFLRVRPGYINGDNASLNKRLGNGVDCHSCSVSRKDWGRVLETHELTQQFRLHSVLEKVLIYIRKVLAPLVYFVATHDNKRTRVQELHTELVSRARVKTLPSPLFCNGKALRQVHVRFLPPSIATFEDAVRLISLLLLWSNSLQAPSADIRPLPIIDFFVMCPHFATLQRGTAWTSYFQRRHRFTTAAASGFPSSETTLLCTRPTFRSPCGAPLG